MERRETPRMVSPEGRPREERVRAGLRSETNRFARFVALPTERRLVTRRLGLAILAGVLALFAVGVIGSHVLEGMVRWLHNQPTYQTTFDAIALEPPPPDWYRGGRTAFLERVRQAAQREDRPFSVLDIDLNEVLREFRLYCWVKRVRRVERYAPNRLCVQLEYRRPVAWAYLPGGTSRVLLDEDGVILPIEDVEVQRADLLIWIKGMDLPLIQIVGLDAPYEPQPGHVWKSTEALHGLGKANERVLTAVKLAAFFNDALTREAKPIPPALQPVAMKWQPESGLFVQNAEDTMIYWPQAPGDEAPGQRTAGQRWADLHRWIKRRTPEPIKHPKFIDFTNEGVVVKEGKSPHEKSQSP
jgi:hypothetical protein